MIVERITFRAKYGQGDALAEFFREWGRNLASQLGVGAARLYTDATGSMFTVQVEHEFADLAAYTAYAARRDELFATPEFGDWFDRMQAVVERGERQLFNAQPLPIG